MAINEKARHILDHVSRTESNIKNGRLKIFLGMVAGVGKTYAMLGAAKTLKNNGVNVVIGLIETHGRKETEQMIEGLPILPKKEIIYKGRIFQELDLDTVIYRRPEIVLIDELAHTNIPGSLHEKRYQDVLDILGQGIDVYTSLNVQHIESCAGLIQNITGIVISETLPDTVLDTANEIVLIDLDPDQIIERLKSGKIYPQEKIQSSLDNYFKKSNLIALRETVLRLLADRVNVELRDLKVVHGIPQIWKTSFRILVPIIPSNSGEYLIRMSRRMASGLNARWIAAQVDESQKVSQDDEKSIRKNALLAKQLGAEVISIHDNSFFDGIRRLIREHQITHLVIARKQKNISRQLSRLSTHFPEVDIVFLSTEKTEKTNKILTTQPWLKFNFKGLWSLQNILFSFSTLGVLTLILVWVFPESEYRTVGMIYLLFLCLNSLFSSPFVVILTTLLTRCLWNIVFIPPRFTFHIASNLDWLTLVCFLFVSLVIGIQTAKIKKKERIVNSNDERIGFMHFLTKNLFEVTGIQKIIQLTLERITRNFQVEAGVILSTKNKAEKMDGFLIGGGFALDDKELGVARWVLSNGRSAGRFTDTLNSASGMYFPLTYRNENHGVLCIIPKETIFSSNQVSIFEDVARHLALVIERDNLEEKTRSMRVQQASEKIYSTLLNSVSHELKTPLSAITGAASSLVEDEILKRPDLIKQLSQEIMIGSQRMLGLIQNLLDMSRLEAGKIVLKKESYDFMEVMGSVLSYVEQYYPDRKVVLNYSEEKIPFAFIDEGLIQQAIKNIIQNACLYTPTDAVINISVSRLHRFLKIAIRDHGPGLPVHNPNIIFEKFYRKDNRVTGGTGIGLTISKAIIELHDGNIDVENHPEGGALFNIKIPAFPEENGGNQ